MNLTMEGIVMPEMIEVGFTTQKMMHLFKMLYSRGRTVWMTAIAYEIPLLYV